MLVCGVMVFWQAMLLLYVVVGLTVATCLWVAEYRGDNRRSGAPWVLADLPLAVGITVGIVVLWPLFFLATASDRLLGWLMR